MSVAEAAILRPEIELNEPMLTALQLGNFKAFANTQKIPIRPLTLIFGPNSAGKSSVLQGLTFARRAMENGDLDQSASGGMDLGGFSQYVHGQNLRKRVELGFDLLVEQMHEAGRKRFGSATSVNVCAKVGLFDGVLGTTGISILTDGKLLLAMEAAHSSNLASIVPTGMAARTPSPENDSPAQICRSGPMKYWVGMDGEVNSDNTLLRAWFTNQFRDCAGLHLTDADWDYLRSQAEELFDHPCHTKRLLPQGLNEQIEPLGKRKVKITTNSQRKRFLKEFGTAVAADYLDGLFNDLFVALDRQLGRVSHLGPLRWYPSRRILDSDDIASLGDGAVVWQTLMDSNVVRKRMNQTLGRLSTPYELTVRKWKAQAGGGAPASSMRELLIADQRSGAIVSARDIGVGVSQVLPVLAAAFGTRHHIHAIEQPELHLHPALQAELGDVFIESALGERKNTFLLETHSEHLILRLLRRVRETQNGSLPRGMAPLRPEDISVLYVQPGKEGSQVTALTVTSDGDFSTRWPNGFFTERSEELF